MVGVDIARKLFATSAVKVPNAPCRRKNKLFSSQAGASSTPSRPPGQPPSPLLQLRLPPTAGTATVGDTQERSSKVHMSDVELVAMQRALPLATQQRLEKERGRARKEAGETGKRKSRHSRSRCVPRMSESQSE